MNAEQRAEALALIAEGLSDRAVAERTGVHRQTVKRLRGTPGTVPDAPTGVPADVPDVPTRVPAGEVVAHLALDGVPATVVLHLSERELVALAFHLLATRLGGPLTVEAWVNRIAMVVAVQVLRNASGVVAEPIGERHTFTAPKCPRCGGAVLVDQTGRRCLNRGCDWTGKA